MAKQAVVRVKDYGHHDKELRGLLCQRGTRRRGCLDHGTRAPAPGAAAVSGHETSRLHDSASYRGARRAAAHRPRQSRSRQVARSRCRRCRWFSRAGPEWTVRRDRRRVADDRRAAHAAADLGGGAADQERECTRRLLSIGRSQPESDADRVARAEAPRRAHLVPGLLRASDTRRPCRTGPDGNRLLAINDGGRGHHQISRARHDTGRTGWTARTVRFHPFAGGGERRVRRPLGLLVDPATPSRRRLRAVGGAAPAVVRESAQEPDRLQHARGIRPRR